MKNFQKCQERTARKSSSLQNDVYIEIQQYLCLWIDIQDIIGSSHFTNRPLKKLIFILLGIVSTYITLPEKDRERGVLLL